MSEKLQELKKIRYESMQTLKNHKLQLEKLLQEELVKSYIANVDSASELTNKISKLNLEIKTEEMSECNHIWITSEISRFYDGHRTDTDEYFGCVKCGLDTHAQERAYSFGTATDLDYVMAKVLGHNSRKGISTKIICSLTLARAVYKSLLLNHPDLSDEDFAKYLELEIDMIQKTDLTKEQQEQKAKSLGLSPIFNAWKRNDVISRN